MIPVLFHQHLKILARLVGSRNVLRFWISLFILVLVAVVIKTVSFRVFLTILTPISRLLIAVLKVLRPKNPCSSLAIIVSQNSSEFKIISWMLSSHFLVLCLIFTVKECVSVSVAIWANMFMVCPELLLLSADLEFERMSYLVFGFQAPYKNLRPHVLEHWVRRFRWQLFWVIVLNWLCIRLLQKLHESERRPKLHLSFLSSIAELLLSVR